MNDTTDALVANVIESTPEDLRIPPPQWRRFIPRWLRGLLWVDEAKHYDAFLCPKSRAHRFAILIG